MAIKQLIIVFLTIFTINGCASSVSRSASFEKAQAVIREIGEVKASIAPEAYEKVAEYKYFSIDELHRAVVAELAKKAILVIDPDLPKMKVEVTNVRIRSGITAVLFGFLAGSDNLAANIIVFNAQGKEMDRFKVSSSYAWGGSVGSQYEVRMGYLYGSFAKRLADEFDVAESTEATAE